MVIISQILGLNLKDSTLNVVVAQKVMKDNEQIIGIDRFVRGFFLQSPSSLGNNEVDLMEFKPVDGGSEVGYMSEGTKILSGKRRKSENDEDDDRKGKKIMEHDEDTKGKGVDCHNAGEEDSDDSEDGDGGIPIIVIEGIDRTEVAKIKIQNMNSPGYIPVAFRIGKKYHVMNDPHPLSLDECPHICFPWGSRYDTHYYHNENRLNPLKEPYDSFSQNLTSILMVPNPLDAEGTVTVLYLGKTLEHKIPKRLITNYITLHKMVYFHISFFTYKEPSNFRGFEIWPRHVTVFEDEGGIDLSTTPPGYKEFCQWLGYDSESYSIDEDSQAGSSDEDENNYDGGDFVDEHDDGGDVVDEHDDGDTDDKSDDEDDDNDDDDDDEIVNNSEIEDDAAEQNELVDDFFATPGADNQVSEDAEGLDMEVNDDDDLDDIPGGADWVDFLGKLALVRIVEL